MWTDSDEGHEAILDATLRNVYRLTREKIEQEFETKGVVVGLLDDMARRTKDMLAHIEQSEDIMDEAMADMMKTQVVVQAAIIETAWDFLESVNKPTQ